MKPARVKDQTPRKHKSNNFSNFPLTMFVGTLTGVIDLVYE
jgi:hypothetical protein